jgi:hypothetical protein
MKKRPRIKILTTGINPTISTSTPAKEFPLPKHSERKCNGVIHIYGLPTSKIIGRDAERDHVETTTNCNCGRSLTTRTWIKR